MSTLSVDNFAWHRQKSGTETYPGGARLLCLCVEDDEGDAGDKVASVVGVVSAAAVDRSEDLILCMASHSVRQPCGVAT